MSSPSPVVVKRKLRRVGRRRAAWAAAGREIDALLAGRTCTYGQIDAVWRKHMGPPGGAVRARLT